MRYTTVVVVHVKSTVPLRYLRYIIINTLNVVYITNRTLLLIKPKNSFAYEYGFIIIFSFY